MFVTLVMHDFYMITFPPNISLYDYKRIYTHRMKIYLLSKDTDEWIAMASRENSEGLTEWRTDNPRSILYCREYTSWQSFADTCIRRLAKVCSFFQMRFKFHWSPFQFHLFRLFVWFRLMFYSANYDCHCFLSRLFIL